VTLVLERAEKPMRASEIHAVAEQLAGGPLCWTSVKGTLAAYAEGSKPRFERIQRGYYRERKHATYFPKNRRRGQQRRSASYEARLSMWIFGKMRRICIG